MTQETGRAAAGITECPPWCATDHDQWGYTHESAYAPMFIWPLSFCGYAAGSAGKGPEDHHVTVGGQNTQSKARAYLHFDDPKQAHTLAQLLELLAQAAPDQIRALAGQVRAAAAAISGEAS